MEEHILLTDSITFKLDKLAVLYKSMNLTLNKHL